MIYAPVVLYNLEGSILESSSLSSQQKSFDKKYLKIIRIVFEYIVYAMILFAFIYGLASLQ